jgi:hypothetical protein
MMANMGCPNCFFRAETSAEVSCGAQTMVDIAGAWGSTTSAGESERKTYGSSFLDDV